MFAELTDRLERVIKTLRGQGKVTEKNIDEALKHVRKALLEADVNYKVVREFLDQVRADSLGERVLQSVSPGQQIVKIIHERLVQLLGGQHRTLRFAKSPGPTVWMLVGLNGSGKTTTCAKLAARFAKAGRRPHLVACDLARPAAIDQLQRLGAQLGVPVYSAAAGNPIDVAVAGVNAAREAGNDLVIIDTAGRLHVNDELMGEVATLKARVNPTETLFVADAMTGQDAVTSATAFATRVGLDGIVFSKLDGDARGGAALSIVKVTGVPILFVGVGEKVEDLEPFHPDRMADRILGMGDVVTLVEKAQQTVDAASARKLEEKLRKAQFDFEDFLEQIRQIEKMGSWESLLGMIPGAARQLKGIAVDPRAHKGMEAMILSMTPYERRHPEAINGSRRLRIARGSGCSIQDVNRLLKQFEMMQKMVRTLSKPGRRGLPALPLGPGMR